MPRGYWDWGVNSGGVVTSPEVSPAELAARLGSIAVYDRQGEALLLEGYEDSDLNWLLTPGAAGSFGRRDTSSARHGGYSYVLVTAPTTNDSITSARDIPLGTGRRFGVEASFALHSSLDDGIPSSHIVFLDLRLADGASITNGSLRITLPGGQVAALTSPTTYTDVGAAQTLYGHSKVYHTLKFVIDLDTGRYARAVLNGTSLPVSTVILETGVTTTRPRMRALLTVQALSNEAKVVRWDDIILTQNEP